MCLLFFLQSFSSLFVLAFECVSDSESVEMRLVICLYQTCVSLPLGRVCVCMLISYLAKNWPK